MGCEDSSAGDRCVGIDSGGKSVETALVLYHDTEARCKPPGL